MTMFVISWREEGEKTFTCILIDLHWHSLHSHWFALTFSHISSLIGGSDYKLIYRHYATLYFVFCVDSSESELGILDLIQVFVETLDKCFENVCELDLIFHVDKVMFRTLSLLIILPRAPSSYGCNLVKKKCAQLPKGGSRIWGRKGEANGGDHTPPIRYQKHWRCYPQLQI